MAQFSQYYQQAVLLLNTGNTSSCQSSGLLTSSHNTHKTKTCFTSIGANIRATSVGDGVTHRASRWRVLFREKLQRKMAGGKSPGSADMHVDITTTHR